MIKVNLFYLSYLHYRDSLFKEISNRSHFTLWCSDINPYDGIDGQIPTFLPYKVVKARNYFLGNGRHRLTIQIFPILKLFKSLKKRKNTYFILLGVDPHIISNLFYGALLKILGFNVSWWGHGTIGTGMIRVLRLFFFRYCNSILVYGHNAEVLKYENLRDKVHVVGNCLNYDDYIESDLDLKLIYSDKNIITIIYSGRITSNKDLDLLVEALIQLDDRFNLFIIGNGPYLNDLKLKTNEIQNIRFLGAIYGSEVKKYFKAANLMVIPGKVGLSIVHAYSQNLPVLIHDSFDEHSPESEIHTRNSNFLFEKGNVNSLIDKLNSLTLKLLHQESINCRNQITEFGYTPTSVANKIINAITND